MNSRLAKLVDDFPRKLTKFETDKIGVQLKTALANSAPASAKSDVIMADRISVCLSNLQTWPASTSIRVIDQLGQKDLFADDRLAHFMARTMMFTSSLNIHSLFQLLTTCHAARLPHLSELLHEIVVARELDGLTQLEIVRVAAIAVIHDESSILKILAKLADCQCDCQLHMALLAYRLKLGELGLPVNLIPILSQSDLTEILRQLCLCEFPHLIAETVRQVSDCFSRLSFHRLTSATEKTEIQTLLFKLKVRLDQMIFVDNNPFYKNIFTKKITRALSNHFQEIAPTVPLAIASKQMLELIGLNALSLHSVDAISRRIEAFGETLLLPSALDSASFSNLVWALTHHPQGKKRVDKLRTSVATQLAGGFNAHLPTLTTMQVVSCCSSLMHIHNSAVRLVVALAISDRLPDIVGLSNEDKIAIASIYSTLLRKNRRHLSATPLVQIVDSIKLFELSMPQLVKVSHVAEFSPQYCATLVDAVETRIRNGGSVSPSNTVKLLHYLAKMNHLVNVDSALILTLVSALPATTSPLIAAQLVSILVSFSNPQILELSTQFIEDQLLLLAVPENFQVLEEQPRVAFEFQASLDLLGENGANFKHFLTSQPGDSTLLI